MGPLFRDSGDGGLDIGGLLEEVTDDPLAVPAPPRPPEETLQRVRLPQGLLLSQLEARSTLTRRLAGGSFLDLEIPLE